MVEGRVHQINVSFGGVPKRPITSGTVTSEGLDGDFHNDTLSHGGPTAALCLYTLEQIQRLQDEGHPIFPGSVGENITLQGIPQSALVPGARLRLGENVLIQITRYTTPCKTILHSFSNGDFTRISQKVYPGESRVYASVLRGGEIHPGDPVRILPDEP